MKNQIRTSMGISVHNVVFCVSLIAALAVPSLHSAPLDMRSVRDIPYVTGAGADAKYQTLDLYLPQGKTSFPLIFFVHGGGFTRGDKSPDGYMNFVDFFLKEGIGITSTNYRLSPAVQHPAHVQDVAKAFAWVYNHASDYQIDRGRIFIAGHSAGAYLVSLLALDRQYLAQESLSPQAFRGVITISGVYDRLGAPSPGAAPMPSATQLGGANVGNANQLPPWLITFTVACRSKARGSILCF